MNITVCGSSGKMGKSIVSLIKNDESIKIFGEIDSKINSGKNLCYFLPKTDVVIDFTSPISSIENLRFAKEYLKPIVIGTTGFNKIQKKEIFEISKIIPIVLSPNMSIGVNVLFKIVEIITKKLPNYDIEVLELHHNKKKDSPSGTAIKISEIIASSLKVDINKVAVYGRHFENKIRENNEIGISSIRAGGIVGDHTVFFVGQDERIELTHRANSRNSFSYGSIVAAKWIINKKSGLYDMFDVLGL
jgi:4-hydroxy-tetrahydrodipicolinate reductase